MQSTAPLRTTLALAAVVAVAAGCATSTADDDTFSASATDAAEPAAVIQVEADVQNVESPTIYLIPEPGSRIRLGAMETEPSRNFAVEQLPSATRFHLMADYGAEEMVSRSFDMGQGDVITWDLELNRLFFGADLGDGGGR